MTRRAHRRGVAAAPAGSIAAVVLGDPRRPSRTSNAPGVWGGGDPAPGTLGAAVLGQPTAPRWVVASLAAGAGAAVLGAGFAWLPAPRASIAAPPEPRAMAIEYVAAPPPAEVSPPAAERPPEPRPPEPQPAPSVPEPAPAPPSPEGADGSEPVEPAPAAPARAGDVVAADAPNEPVDFTGFDIASGDAPRFAGGVTAGAGTNPNAVRADADAVRSGGAHRTSGGRGRGRSARPPVLRTEDPTCPWPEAATDLDIDEKVVTVRATIHVDGHVEAHGVVGDPGDGFGHAALRCARERLRFEPARDAAGKPRPSGPRPIRIRITRASGAMR
ncbi:MAG: ferric siderophore ABC transporter substrate-binding protein [Myxococcota bacterium]